MRDPSPVFPPAKQDQSRAKTKAAYRFFEDGHHTLDKILTPHYEATRERVKQEPVVLAVQDSTSLNYATHPASANWRIGQPFNQSRVCRINAP